MKKDKSTRIAIIGAGPAGLSAAYKLKEIGYKDVTIFERTNRVGGMALSKTYKDSNGHEIVYDLGSIQPFGSKDIFALLKKFNLHIGLKEKKAKTSKFKIYSLEKRAVILDFDKYLFGVPFYKAFPILSDASRLLKTLLRNKRLFKPGYGNTPNLEELSIDQETWIFNQNFKAISPFLRLLSCGSQNCGNPEEKDDHPFIQTVKSLLNDLFSLSQRYTRGIYLPVTEGYQEIWKRVAIGENILFLTEIEKIERADQKIILKTSENSYQFDELIIACPPNRLLGVVDYGQEEEEIFHKIHFSPGWSYAMVAKKPPENGVLIFIESMQSINHSPLYGLIRREKTVDGSHVCHGIIGYKSPEGIKEVLSQIEVVLHDHFGTTEIRWLDKVYWPYYNAHFQCKDTAEGIYDRLEALQGLKNTYYTGELLNGGANSLVVDYSFDLVKRFF